MAGTQDLHESDLVAHGFSPRAVRWGSLAGIKTPCPSRSIMFPKRLTTMPMRAERIHNWLNQVRGMEPISGGKNSGLLDPTRKRRTQHCY